MQRGLVLTRKARDGSATKPVDEGEGGEDMATSAEDIELELERQLQEEERQASVSSDSDGQGASAAWAPPPGPPLPAGPPQQRPMTEAERKQYEAYLANEKDETFKELLYSFNSFLAVFWPVSVTVILAALAVVYINTGSNGNGQGGIASLPQIFDENTATSDVSKAGYAVANALLIVGIITGATFVMVGLFYLNMIRVLITWLVTATGLLLFITTSFMVSEGLKVYNVPFDAVSFYFFFWNYAICGLIAIFYQKGMPVIVNQAYLVGVSVVMAWLLVAFLPAWTSWALLIMLALYDLCAVLTPVGPLKCLIEISQDKDVGMPGLLYEANITNHHHNGYRQDQNEQQMGSNGSVSAASDSSSRESARRSGNYSGGAAMAGPLGMFVFMAAPPSSRPFAPSNASDDDSVDELETGYRAEHERGTHAGAIMPSPPGAVAEFAEGPSFGDRDSIKLGLGDFVFYSVLVGRAALNGLSTFFAVYVVVVAGLASTLFLLAVYHKALPALPISIFFGVFFFFVADLLITPMVNSLVQGFSPL